MLDDAFFSIGQLCTASSRLIITEGIYDRFVDALKERMKNLVFDNALKESTHIRPVVGQSQFDQNLGYLRIGQEEGVRLPYDG